MPNLRSKAIHLAATNPEIRSALLPILKQASLPTLKMDWEDREARSWRRWGIWQNPELLRRSGMHTMYGSGGYVVTQPVSSAMAAEAAAEKGVKDWIAGFEHLCS